MNAPKQSRRRIGVKKLAPIDWHEFANDAVLNGNMSTLYHRPPTEDPTAYASPEALIEIKKRIGGPVQSDVVIDFEVGALDGPTVGTVPTVGDRANFKPLLEESDSAIPPVGLVHTVGASGAKHSEGTTLTVGSMPTVCDTPTVGGTPAVGPLQASPVDHVGPLPIGIVPTHTSVRSEPTVGTKPTVGMVLKKRAKPIRDVQDALTLAGQVLYKAMYGAPDGAKSKSCRKGYRQLAAETHLDKDTVRDLISEFKVKGIVRETGTYDPDTRSAKTYEVLSYKAILQTWRDIGFGFVTTGRQRPMFCTAQGELLTLIPPAGIEPIMPNQLNGPTVGPLTSVLTGRSTIAQRERQQLTEVIQALQQITGNPVDQEAADRLIGNCRTLAPDCTIEEIVEFAWSKAFLCRSGKIENPVGFLITQVPKHFQSEALQSYRENKRKELEAAAALAARAEQRRQEAEREISEMEELQYLRSKIAERHRIEQGIDLKGLLEDSEADDALKEWARRMLKLGHRYQPRYD